MAVELAYGEGLSFSTTAPTSGAITFWWLPTLLTEDQEIFDYESNYFVNFINSTDKLEVCLGRGASKALDSVTTFTAGTLYHIALNYEITTKSYNAIYVDGVLDASNEQNDFGVSATTMYVGGSSGTIRAEIDDLRWYTAPLTAAEISTIAATRGTDGIYTNLQYRWVWDGVPGANTGGVYDIFAGKLMTANAGSPQYSEGFVRQSRRGR